MKNKKFFFFIFVLSIFGAICLILSALAFIIAQSLSSVKTQVDDSNPTLFSQIYNQSEVDGIVNSAIQETMNKYFQKGYVASHLKTEKPTEILYNYNNSLISGIIKIPNNIEYTAKFRNEGSPDAIFITYKASTLTIWGKDQATKYFDNGDENFNLSTLQHEALSALIVNDIHRVKPYNPLEVKSEDFMYLAKSESTQVCAPAYIPCYKKAAIEDYDKYGTVEIFAGVSTDLSEEDRKDVLNVFDGIVKSLELSVVEIR